MVPVSRSHHPVVQAGSAATALQLDHSLQQDQQLHNLHQPAQLGYHCYCELYLYVWECNTTIWARNVKDLYPARMDLSLHGSYTRFSCSIIK